MGGDDPFSGAPDSLQNVVATGGTSLYTSTTTGSVYETSWNEGAGGVSRYVPEPSYQEGVQTSNFRETPDVSFDANETAGGVPVLDSYRFGNVDPWEQIGGTSLAAPSWAGIFAIINQGRVLAGAARPSTARRIQTQSRKQALYSIPSYDYSLISSRATTRATGPSRAST